MPGNQLPHRQAVPEQEVSRDSSAENRMAGVQRRRALEEMHVQPDCVTPPVSVEEVIEDSLGHQFFAQAVHCCHVCRLINVSSHCV